MTIKISMQATIDIADAPSREALTAVAVAFFQLRGALAWADGVSMKYEAGTQTEKDAFRSAILLFSQSAQSSSINELRDKAEARQAEEMKAAKPIVTVIGGDDEPLMRPAVKQGFVSERPES